MNRDAFKILLQNDLIPTIYKTETSYLIFNDVYNLNLCSKNIRFQIENFCKSRCQSFEDFQESKNIKFNKYKTWFTSLLFWECKYSKIILKHLIPEKTTTIFIPIIPFCESQTVQISQTRISRRITIFPRIELIRFEPKLKIGFCIEEKEESSLSRELSDIVTKINSKCETYEEFKRCLSIEGFFSIDQEQLAKQIIRINQPLSFLKNDAKNKSFYKHISELKKSVTINKQRYVLTETSKESIIFFCEMFEVESTLANFQMLCKEKKINFDWGFMSFYYYPKN